MKDLLLNLMASFAICVLLVAICIWRRVLSRSGNIAAFGMGMMIGVLGDFTWLLVLVTFLGISVAATKFRYKEKKRMGVAEGGKGERGFDNVIANGGMPALVALLSWDGFGIIDKRIGGLLYLCAVASALSDTLASEIGVFSPDAVLITTFRKVKPGTNGGISLLGTGTALFGAMFIGTAGWLLLVGFSDTAFSMPFVIAIPSFAGFMGCNIDSMLGATLENAGHLGKGSVNYISSAGATFFGLLLTYFVLI